MMPSVISGFGERRRKPFLLVEIGLLDARLYTIQPERDPIKVRLLKRLPLVQGDLTSLYEALDKILSIDLPYREVAVVVNSAQIYHQLISIPVMRGAQRKKVLEHEIKEAAGTSGEQEFISFWSAGELRQDGIAEEKVLCSKLPRFLAEVVTGTLKEKGLNIIGFTSNSQMLCHLVADHQEYALHNLLLLEINEREGSVTLFDDGVWAMERRFLVTPASNRPADTVSASESAVDQEKLLLEVDRAVRYFNQRSRQDPIHRILLYGATIGIDEITSVLEQATKLPVSPLYVDPRKFDISFDENEGSLRDALLYNIPCIVALHSNFADYIDFVPAEIRQRRPTAARRIAVAALALTYYAILILIALRVHREASQLSERSGAPDLVPRSATANQAVQQVLDLRTFALATRQTESWLKERHRALSGIARELAALMPEQMSLSSIQFQEQAAAWRLSFKAEIQSSSGSRSQELLFLFQSQVRQSRWLKHLTLNAVTIADREAASEDSARPTNVLTLEMSGQLVYAPPTT